MSAGWKSYAEMMRARTHDLFRHPDGRGEATVGKSSDSQLPTQFKLSEPVTLSEEDQSSFPTISDIQLQKLFPGATQYTCVRSALRDMELAYKMDPCLMNQKSHTSEGYKLLAELLRRIEVESANIPRLDPKQTSEVQETPAVLPTPKTPARTPRVYEAHDVYAAIERQDIETIMAIRDANFALLLGSNDSKTPLEYAIGLGPSYERMGIFLAGAMSRFVNHLSDDMQEVAPVTLETLRKVRANLKLAIDHSLDQEQTSLLASYIQILVMAEGIQWISHSVKAVAHALRSQPKDPYAPRPTQEARNLISSFLTQNLRLRRERDQYIVAAMEDYIANATSDLVFMALWECVRLNDEDPLPDYAFARDDRVAVEFCRHISDAQHYGDRRPHRTWKQALRARDSLDGGLRNRTAEERLKLLETIVD
ncbi:hypothetical protein MYAM1_001108 [Malassezia yamatoensis]|uniref:Uncharacterized protein n=1 Tax=Malassezia yamatoensis TaxID=253288 RepID=A0AAJ6CI13_9BASI|nr:hypothetical protein MYAM1_001108 [Malassezia yamatoensis]